MNQQLSKPNFKIKLITFSVCAALSQFTLAEENTIDTEKLNTEVAEPIKLEEITVTGTKRNQKIQDAVQSVTVFESQDTIGKQNSLDALKYLPNVTNQSNTFLPTVRGLDGNGIGAGGGGAVSGASPRMTNYIDGVARTYSATPDGQGGLWDIEQIEVYKGSQSTQLGRNSIAGAIVQTTKDPKFKDEYAMQAGMHDQNFTYNAALMANKKISDQVAIRFTAETISGSSFIDFSDLQATGLTTSDKNNIGDTKSTRYRLKTLFAPSAIPDLAIKFSLDNERIGNSYAYDLVDEDTSRSRKLVNNPSGRYNSSNTVAALSSTYTINNEFTLDSILSYQTSKTKFGAPEDGNPNPASFLDFTFSVHETVFEPKISYQSSKDRTNGVLGAFYLTRSRTDTGEPGSSFALNADDKSSTESIYGDATIQVAKDWDILVGARLEKDQQKRDFSAFGGLLALNFNVTNNAFLPKIGATYHVTQDASVSLLTYKGYTASGGGLSFVTFTPYAFNKETAQTTELVTRTQWFNKTLTANANIFYTRLKDLQVSAIGPAGPLDAIYSNLEKAQTVGAEFELAYAPDAKTKTFLSLGLLKTKIDDFGSTANNQFNGNELALSPSATARIGVYREIYPNLTIGADASYTAKRYSDYQNTEVDELPSYVVANLNARYRYKNATITSYVNNIGNKFVETSKTMAFNQVYVNAPRTVGVNVKLDY